MSVKFRSNLSGFNRNDVLGYIQKLSGEKGRLSKENSQLKSELKRANERIKQLEELNSVLTNRAAEAVLERDDAIKREKAAQDSALEARRTAYSAVSDTLAELETALKNAGEQLNRFVSSAVEAQRDMNTALTAAESAVSRADGICRSALTEEGKDENI